MNNKKKLSILVGFLLNSSLMAMDKKDNNINELSGLSLEELMRVEVVSIATGKQQTIAEAPAVTKVITEKDIETMGATDLSEVLATVPGFHVARNKFLYMPIYTVRGVYTGQYNPQVLFLINGSSVSTLYTGGKGFSQGNMLVKNIERIEIMKSPGSAIYGADAVSAVVNIITKQKTDILGTQIGAKVESFNTQNVWMQHSNRLKESDITASVEILKTDGAQNIIEEDYQTTLDQWFNTKVSLAPAPVQRGGKTVNASFSISRENLKLQAGALMQRDLQLGIGAGQTLDNIGKMDTNQYLIDLTYHNDKLVTDWEVIAKATYFYFGFDSPTPETILMPGVRILEQDYPNGGLVYAGAKEYRGNLGLDVFYKGWKDHLIRVGTGYQHATLYDVKQIMNMIPTEDGNFLGSDQWINVSNTPYTFTPTGVRNNNYLFIQDSYKFLENWELTAGVRYDKYSDFGSVITPRAALVWKTLPELTTKLIYGKAFRAPAIFELYGRYNPLGIGNPNLKPERIQTTELAFDYQPLQDLKLGLNLFHFKVDKGIGYINSEFEAYPTASNNSEQTGKGFELEVRWRALNNFVLSGHYAFAQTTEKNLQATAGNIPHPKHSAYLKADWSIIKDWSLNTQLNWTGIRKRAFNDPRSNLKGYSLVDVMLNYKPKHNWRWRAGIKNLFDSDAREPSSPPNVFEIISVPNDYPLPKRTFSLEINYHF